MNIQPSGAPVASKLDDRVAALDSQNATRPAAAPAGASVAVRAAMPGQTAEPTREELDDAVKKINESLPASAQGLEFSVDEDNKQTVVKIIDLGTREVVRQIPTVEALEIAKALDKAVGKLINQTA